MSESTSVLVNRWRQADRILESAKSSVTTAATEFLNATNALGAHLCPDDMRNGETIAIWVRLGRKDERLVSVTKTNDGGNGSYQLRYRSTTRPIAPKEQSS